MELAFLCGDRKQPDKEMRSESEKVLRGESTGAPVIAVGWLEGAETPTGWGRRSVLRARGVVPMTAWWGWGTEGGRPRSGRKASVAAVCRDEMGRAAGGEQGPGHGGPC